MIYLFLKMKNVLLKKKMINKNIKKLKNKI